MIKALGPPDAIGRMAGTLAKGLLPKSPRFGRQREKGPGRG